MTTELVKLSHSRIKTYQTCQRKFYWEYVRRIVPSGRSYPLEFGLAWHLAMGKWHHHRDLGQAIAAFNATFLDGEDRKRTQDTAKVMLTKYAERYPEEPFTITATERWIEQPLGPVLYRVRVDHLISWQGEPQILEHKTTSSLGFHFLKSFKPNTQVVGGIWAARKEFDGPINTMVIDIALVTKLEPRDGDRFVRYPEVVEDWQLEEFESYIVDVGTEIQLKGPEFEEYTPNWGACTQYGECPYRRLCVVPHSVRENVIAAEYQPRPAEESYADT